jgi:hypothetical protein
LDGGSIRRSNENRISRWWTIFRKTFISYFWAATSFSILKLGFLHSITHRRKLTGKTCCFLLRRGREDLSVLIAPRHAPNLSYELGSLVAAVENRQYSERDVIASLSDAANLLRPRLKLLNTAFSEQEFPRTREKLWK